MADDSPTARWVALQTRVQSALVIAVVFAVGAAVLGNVGDPFMALVSAVGAVIFYGFALAFGFRGRVRTLYGRFMDFNDPPLNEWENPHEQADVRPEVDHGD